MEDWKEYKYTELASLIGGGTPKTTEASYWNGNIPWLSVKDFCGNSKYVYKTEKHITELGLRNSSTKLLHRGDIIISARGTVGEIAMLPYDMAFNQSCFGIRANVNVINNHYLYYLTKTKVRELQNSSHGSVFDTITKDTFENINCYIPNINEQIKIAAILSSLDDKIELNRRINGNLEQQAQALFKAWFVDFEPFKSGKFVDSELGRIPEGWKVGQLDELVEIKYGKDHKKLLPGNIPVYGSGGIMRHVNMPIYEKESVLIPRKGSLNNVLYVNHPFWTVDTMFYTRMKINGIAKFIYLFISPIDLLSMNNGSAVPSMTTEILSKIRLVIPSKNIFDNFESLVAPFFDKIGSCNKEICKLSNLRDALLPKLLSGELNINTITE